MNGKFSVKLIRNKLANEITKNKTGKILKSDNKINLNKLFSLKVVEELEEILKSDHSDISEFSDLIQVVFDWALLNGFKKEYLFKEIHNKNAKFGVFRNDLLVLEEEELDTEEIKNNKNNYKNG